MKRLALVLPVAPLMIVLLFASTLGADAAGAHKGGMTATISETVPGSCTFDVFGSWPHPKHDQSYVDALFTDVTTGQTWDYDAHFPAPTVSSTYTSIDVESFPFTSGGPDTWVGEMRLYDSGGKLLAFAVSAPVTFNCTQ